MSSPSLPAQPTEAAIEAGHSLWQDAWARLRKNKLALASAFLVAALGLVCAAAPWVSPHAYDAQDKTMKPVAGSGGLSGGASELEGSYANAWARNIWNDMLT